MWTRGLGVGIGIAISSGGLAKSGAESLAGAFTDVIAISTRDMTIVVRDSGTPANNYSGSIASNGDVTVNGTLTANAAGALFSDTDNLTFLSNIVSWSWTTVGMYVQLTPTSVNNATGDRVLTICDGTFDNVMELLISTTSSPDVFGFTTRVAGVSQGTPLSTVSLSTSGHIIRAGWATNNAAISVDSEIPVTDVTLSIPTITRVDVGYASHTASRGFKGRIPSVVITPTRNSFVP